MNSKFDVPNKRARISGIVCCTVGLILILLRVLVYDKTWLIVVGVILILSGILAYYEGKYGRKKFIRDMAKYQAEHNFDIQLEKAKAKEIAKGVKEGLKDDEE